MEKIRLIICLLILAFDNPAIAGDTNRFDSMMFEGDTNFAKGDFDDAIADFSMAIQLNPTNDWAIFDRAGAYRAKGEFEKSIRDYDKYILLNPTNDYAFKSRASDFCALGEFERGK